MNEFIKAIETNKKFLLLIIAILMFIFFAISAIDVAGKVQAGGFRVLFKGTGLGFARFLSGIILIVPILVVTANFVNFNLSGKLKENFNAICFVVGFIACIIMVIALPDHITLAWGGWIYALLAAGGTAVSCIEHFKK